MVRAHLDMDQSEHALFVLETISQELLMRQGSEEEGAKAEGSGAEGAGAGDATEGTGGSPEGKQEGLGPEVSLVQGCRLFHRLMDSLEMTQTAREEGTGSPTVIDDSALDVFTDAPEEGANDAFGGGEEDGQMGRWEDGRSATKYKCTRGRGGRR